MRLLLALCFTRTGRIVLMLGVLRLAERMQVRLSEHGLMPAPALGAVAA